MTGRRRSRSTHAPARNPTSSTARLADTTISAISVGPAPSTSSATSGTAVRVTTEPTSEIVCPTHSFMKSACRQRDVVIAAGYSPVGRSRAGQAHVLAFAAATLS